MLVPRAPTHLHQVMRLVNGSAQGYTAGINFFRKVKNVFGDHSVKADTVINWCKK